MQSDGKYHWLVYLSFSISEGSTGDKAQIKYKIEAVTDVIGSKTFKIL